MNRDTGTSFDGGTIRQPPSRGEFLKALAAAGVVGNNMLLREALAGPASTPHLTPMDLTFSIKEHTAHSG
jgi:hypothetical protein